MNGSTPGMMKPALIGGFVLGVVGGLPLIGALNCLCCSLVIGAGLFASFLYSKDCKAVGAEFRSGQGVKLGLLTGVFYTIAHTVVGTVAQMIFGGMDQIVQQLEQAEGVPPEVVEFMQNAGGGMLALVGFFVVLVFGLIFGMVGGAIGGSLFKVEAPMTVDAPAPSAPSDPPPPPAPHA